jgi:hypothetical protein
VYEPKVPIAESIKNHLSENSEAFAPLVDLASWNGNEAFHEITPQTVSMVPIAAAQEPPHYLHRALQEYVKQQNQPSTRPFSLVLSLNYPEVENAMYATRVKENREVVDAFRGSAQGRHLPLSFFEVVYPPQTTIGKIRRDLAGVAFAHMLRQYAGKPIPEEAGFFISDIDTRRFSPLCFSRLQSRLEHGYSWSAACKRYLTTGGEFPNLDRCITMLNINQAMSYTASYDCHALYGARTLLAADSFSAADSIFETHEMRARAMAAMGDDFVVPLPRQVPGAIAVSYPRRPAEKIREGKLSYEFWEKGQFTMQDGYREGNFAMPNEDVNTPQANRFIGSLVSDFVGSIRDERVQHLQKQKPQYSYSEARNIMDTHFGRTLQVANSMLNLELEKISVLDGFARS